MVFASPVVHIAACFGDTPTRRPNIVYINADDLGVMDVGFNEGQFHTPHIDALARRGMVFTNAYAPAANCAPSRACVHSGQWTPRHGVYTVGSSERGKSARRKLVPIANTLFLADEKITIAESLRDAGYRTIHLGKYHIGKDPLADGFEVNVGGDHSGSPNGGYYSPWNKGAMSEWTSKVDGRTHRCDVFAEEAARFIAEHHDEPMFVHFSPYLVHTPLTPVAEFVDRYEDSPIDSRYGSMVQKLDQAVGRLVAAIDEHDLASDTLIVFSSDNGGVAAIHSQSPLRAGKGSYYEGGIREPMVVSWSGRIEAGSRCATPVTTLDLYPTFMALAGARVPERQTLDGTDLSGLLLQTSVLEPRDLFWHFPIYLQAFSGSEDDARDRFFRTRPGSVMRSGRWKLHEYFEDAAIELYDLESDPGERNNLASAWPQLASELHARLVQWRHRVDAPIPTQPNPDYRED